MHATIQQRLHHKRVARFVVSVAGLTSAVSVIIGFIAARWTPHGWSKVAVTLHFSHQPLIVRVAAFVAATSAAVAAAAGIVSFYSWCMESREEGSSRPQS